MIKRIAQTAGFTGLLAALLLTLLQSFWVAPLILQAETYENAPAATEVAHQHAEGAAAHTHDAEAWEPENGWQRVLSTTGGNLVVAVGFALMLAGLYTLRAPTRTAQGLLWGLAGYATFVLAPTLGLPPELPGTAAADLALRQTWWIGTAASTAAGIALIVFGRNWLLKVLGVAIIAVPHVIGAPQPEVHSMLAPQALEAQFKIASQLTNVAFWLALGLISAWLFRRNRDDQYSACHEWSAWGASKGVIFTPCWPCLIAHSPRAVSSATASPRWPLSTANRMNQASWHWPKRWNCRCSASAPSSWRFLNTA